MSTQLGWARVHDDSGMSRKPRFLLNVTCSTSIFPIRLLNKSGCASTWSAQEYEIFQWRNLNSGIGLKQTRSKERYRSHVFAAAHT